MKEEYQLSPLSSWQGAWESVNGNSDIYIFQGHNGKYNLLAYTYDKNYERGGFTCYDVESDDNGYYIRMGMKCCRMESEQLPYGLFIAGWGSYMKY